MPVKTILKMGNELLTTAALPVSDQDFGSESLLSIIQDMRDTMKEKGGVGIAAPQIGIQKRIIMFGFEKSERYPNEKPVPFTILINPTITVVSNDMVDGWEGCLSVPGLRGKVPRYNKIKFSGYDPDGNLIAGIAEGFHARVIQHECDHIDGTLFPRRIKDLLDFGFEDEIWEKINKPIKSSNA